MHHPTKSQKNWCGDADDIIADVERKELGRIEKADWYKRFAYIQEDDAYFDLQDRREVSRSTFNALFRHIDCRSIHTAARVLPAVSYDENRQTMGAKALVGITYAAGETVLVSREVIFMVIAGAMHGLRT